MVPAVSFCFLRTVLAEESANTEDAGAAILARISAPRLSEIVVTAPTAAVVIKGAGHSSNKTIQAAAEAADQSRLIRAAG